jgi:hypothetical protein
MQLLLTPSESLPRRIVDVCQVVCNCPYIFERMRRSVMRRVDACIESHISVCTHSAVTLKLNVTLSAVTLKLNVSRRILIWAFFSFWDLVLVPKVLSTSFSFTLYIRY